MIDWPVKTLGDICRIEMGRTPSRGDSRGWDKEFKTSNHWASIADLTACSGSLLTSTKERISDFAAETTRVVPAGTLMMSFKLSIGKLAFAGCDLYTNEAIAAFHLPENADVDPAFLYRALSVIDWSALTKGSEKVKGVTMNKAKLNLLKIPVPPLDEQKRLVALLDAATERVTELTACYEKARTHANNLFTSELTELFEKCAEDTNVKQLSIGEICEIGDGNHSAKYPKSSEFIAQGVPFIRANNISNGKVSAIDMRYISETKHYELKKGHLRTGDVLITNRGEIGSLAIVGSEFDGANLNSQIAWLRVSALVTNRYLYYFLRSPNAKAQFFQGTTGAALQQLTISQLRKIRVPIVPLTTQQTVIDHLDKFKGKSSEMIEAYDAKLTAAKNLRRSVLESAFAGVL